MGASQVGLSWAGSQESVLGLSRRRSLCHQGRQEEVTPSYFNNTFQTTLCPRTHAARHESPAQSGMRAAFSRGGYTIAVTSLGARAVHGSPKLRLWSFFLLWSLGFTLSGFKVQSFEPPGNEGSGVLFSILAPRAEDTLGPSPYSSSLQTEAS